MGRDSTRVRLQVPVGRDSTWGGLQDTAGSDPTGVVNKFLWIVTPLGVVLVTVGRTHLGVVNE